MRKDPSIFRDQNFLQPVPVPVMVPVIFSNLFPVPALVPVSPVTGPGPGPVPGFSNDSMTKIRSISIINKILHTCSHVS